MTISKRSIGIYKKKIFNAEVSLHNNHNNHNNHIIYIHNNTSTRIKKNNKLKYYIYLFMFFLFTCYFFYH